MADNWQPSEEETALIYSFALQNVLEYGEAQMGSIMGKLSQNFDMKQYGKLLPRYVIAQVNKANALLQKEGIEAVREELIRLDSSKMERLEKEKVKVERVFPDLPNVEQGNFKVRFAPNPNAPLTVGHMRGVLINKYYADKYDGDFILRFDDTSTDVKPPIIEAYIQILKDIKWLTGEAPDDVLIASDRMDIYYEYADQLISMNGAYMCNCKNFKELKDASIPCPHRDLSVEENIELFKKMKQGDFEAGEWVLRARTDLDAPNPAHRDFVLFRVQKKAHPRTGDSYKAWPMLDFQSAIDDHLSGVTHIIRGIDLQDSTAKQKILYNVFDWDYPETTYWGRVKILDQNDNEVRFSSSQYAKDIAEGKFTGWDDKRLYTVQAFKNRGYTPDALLNWWLEYGLTRKPITVSMKTLDTLQKREGKGEVMEAEERNPKIPSHYYKTYGKKGAEVRFRIKERILKERSMGTRAGQWSARKSQKLKEEYEKEMRKKGLKPYVSSKRTGKQKDLKKWGDQSWRTKSGRKSSVTGEPYFPKKAIEALKKKKLYAKAKRQKLEATKKGKQYASYSPDIQKVVAQYRAEDDKKKGHPNIMNSDEAEVPRFVYHATPLKYWEKIQNQGKMIPQIGYLTYRAFLPRYRKSKKGLEISPQDYKKWLIGEIGGAKIWATSEDKATIYGVMIDPMAYLDDNVMLKIDTNGLDFRYYNYEEYFTEKEIPLSAISFEYFITGERYGEDYPDYLLYELSPEYDEEIEEEFGMSKYDEGYYEFLNTTLEAEEFNAINVSNTTLSTYKSNRHRKFDHKQARRHKFGMAFCNECGELFMKDNANRKYCYGDCAKIVRKRKRREAWAKRRANWTDEELEEYRRINREKKRESRDNRTKEEWEEYRKKERERWANRTDEELEEYRRKRREYWREKAANMTDEQREEYRRKKRKRMRESYAQKKKSASKEAEGIEYKYALVAKYPEIDLTGFEIPQGLEPIGRNHITIVSGKALKPVKKIVKENKENLDELPVPPKPILGDTGIAIREVEGEKRETYFTAIENQEEFQDYANLVCSALGIKNPEPNRFFHLSIANNQSGDSFKSVGDIEAKDLKKK